MTEKELNNVAKHIKSIMKTSAAGCYRLDVLPRAATIKAIKDILIALGGGSWDPVFESELYKKYGCAYCNILAVAADYISE